jgi:DNA-binding NarL/FixJ family response regulator
VAIESFVTFPAHNPAVDIFRTPSPMKINVSLVDNHATYRTHIQRILSAEGSFAVAREYSNGREIAEDIDAIEAEIILMDLKMPIMDGYDATKFILKRKPETAIIILTLFDESEFILSLNRLGVRGFLSKTIEPETLVHAIKTVHGGGFCYTAEVAQVLRKNLPQGTDLSAVALSEGEKKLLNLICEGRSSVEIAECVHKSSRTVEDYRQKLYQKFKVNNKEQLIVKCVKLNLIP